MFDHGGAGMLAAGAALLVLRAAAHALTRGELSAGDLAQLGLLGLAERKRVAAAVGRGQPRSAAIQPRRSLFERG